MSVAPRTGGRTCLPAAALVVAALMVPRVAAERKVPLVDAVKARDQHAVVALLSEKANVNAPEADGATPLHWAAYLDDANIVQTLLAAGAKVNAVNDLGVTPLWLACHGGSAATVERLLQAGATPNVALPSGETPLMAAARSGNAQIVKLLVSAGADVEAKETFRGQTALMWAVAEQHPQAVKALIDVGANVRARSATWTQLVSSGGNHISAGDYEMTQGGSPPLLFAARQGDLESARTLVAAGADVNDTNAAGISALVMAVQSGHPALAAWLLETGAAPNATGAQYTALHAAVLLGDLQSVNGLLSHGANPNAPFQRGTPVRRHSKDFSLHYHDVGATAFWLAARYREPDIMRALARAGADPLFANNGKTAVMAALDPQRHPRQPESNPDDLLIDGPEEENRRTFETVQLALELGVDVNTADATGSTPLHNAAASGQSEVVELLVAKGARLDTKNKRGQTPLGVALAAMKRPGAANAKAAADSLRKLGATE